MWSLSHYITIVLACWTAAFSMCASVAHLIVKLFVCVISQDFSLLRKSVCNTHNCITGSVHTFDELSCLGFSEISVHLVRLLKP